MPAARKAPAPNRGSRPGRIARTAATRGIRTQESERKIRSKGGRRRLQDQVRTPGCNTATNLSQLALPTRRSTIPIIVNLAAFRRGRRPKNVWLRQIRRSIDPHARSARPGYVCKPLVEVTV